MLMPLGAAAVSLSGPVTISTGCCATQTDATITFDPNNTPVTVDGWVDVSGLPVGSAMFFGLLDKKQVDDGGSTFMSGAYVYISRASATTLWIGPSDGNLGGEIVQEFDSPTNETLVNFEAVIGAGTISVNWTAGAQSGGPVVDTYGDVKTLNNAYGYAWDEFQYGAYLGLHVYSDSTPGTVDYTVSAAAPEPATAGLLTLGSVLLGLQLRARRARKA
jgi:hypothetical protein